MKKTVTTALVGLAFFVGLVVFSGTTFASEMDYTGDISGDWGLDYGSSPVADYSGSLSGDWGLDYGSSPATDYTGSLSGDWGLDYGSNPCGGCGNPCGDCGYDNNPSYGCDEYCGGSSGGSSSGGGSYGGFGGSSIGYRPPAITGGGYPIYPPTVYPPQQRPPQYPPVQYPPVNNTNITTNTCTNGSCNNTSTVTNINQVPQQPYYPVVYQQPAPYCTISISNYGNNNYNYGSYNYNQSSTITWSAQNATTAYISGIGQVGTNGMQVVYPTGGMVYTMTVTGPGGSANCQTQSVYIPQPVPTPVPVNLSCRIYASPASIQNGQSTYLSWNATGATNAILSDGIGSVAVNGSLNVRPESSRNYVLTIYGYGGSATCNVTVTVVGTTVSLTQIPYTGFDFGPVGNTLYMLAILAFAGSLAYLALYFQGGALGHVSAALRGMRVPMQTVAATYAPMKTIRVPAAPVAHYRAPVMAQAPATLPVATSEKTYATTDKMTLVASKEGQAPRIVISRS